MYIPHTCTTTAINVRLNHNHAQDSLIFVPRHGGSAELALPMARLDWTAEREEEQPNQDLILRCSLLKHCPYMGRSSNRQVLHAENRFIDGSKTQGDGVRNQAEDHGHLSGNKSIHDLREYIFSYYTWVIVNLGPNTGR